MQPNRIHGASFNLAIFYLRVYSWQLSGLITTRPSRVGTDGGELNLMNLAQKVGEACTDWIYGSMHCAGWMIKVFESVLFFPIFS